MASSPLDPARLPQPHPSWDDLRIFLAVVAHGSLNAAGRALGQSQPTVARRMRVLEDVLGVSLFERGPNNLALTEAGRAILEAASPMAEAADAVPRSRPAYRPDSAAPVRITATMSMTMFLSLSRRGTGEGDRADSHRVHSDAPAARPCHRRGRHRAAHARAAGQRRISSRAALDGSRSRSMPASRRRLGPVIVPPEDPESLATGRAASRVSPRGGPIAARIGDMPIRYQAARSGLGAAVLPCWLGDSDPDLIRVLDSPAEMVEDASLVMHRRSRDLPQVRRVADAIIALFRAKQDVLAGAEAR